MNNKVTLKIVTPEKLLCTTDCDCVRLNISNDEKDKQGGSYGIRKGHAKALVALEKGTVSAHTNGSCVYSIKLSDGFATIENDVVTVVAEEI